LLDVLRARNHRRFLIFQGRKQGQRKAAPWFHRSERFFIFRLIAFCHNSTSEISLCLILPDDASYFRRVGAAAFVELESAARTSLRLLNA
jgi:hypothetical protein